MNKNNRRFKIDLEKSRAPRMFRDEENLWRDELLRIYRLLGQHIETIEQSEKDAAKHGTIRSLPHLSISIFGPSGSGKSSLLRVLADDTSRKHAGVLYEHKKNLVGKIAPLPVMDPTTWTKSEQFLYAFLASALETERQAQENSVHGAPQGLSRVQLAFQKVNEYLRVVDDPGAPGEHDPLGLSLQKLERHTSGLRLRHALGTFLAELAKELGAKVILLPVDDLDMAPDHLVDSLQAYQSYLTHAQLIPIFTFTDRMPEELIEVHYERYLATKKTRRIEASTERLSINEQLAVQFLSRCFPVRNRIRLGPAPARVQRALFTTSSDHENQDDKDAFQVLELLTIASFLLFGHPDKEDAHQIRAALRPSTLRRQLQVIDAMFDCRLSSLRSPQLALMADKEGYTEDALMTIAQGEIKKETRKEWEAFKKNPKDPRYSISQNFWKKQNRRSANISENIEYYLYFRHLTVQLAKLNIGATWATTFSGAAWTLLNVHRDTLRELGLHLEDLYSWSPKELRSVVVNKIFEQDQTIRRAVVDRWFNRTDFRRSQILSVLAANIFRPWMTGEEPHGDEELAVRDQINLEAKYSDTSLPPLDEAWKGLDKTESRNKQDNVYINHLKQRLSFPTHQGLLWFLNVTLGFYLPQIMARNWSTSLITDEPIRGRISGNGWDLYHAPINAMRVADAKQEIFSFGMLFIDPRGYRHALEVANRFETLKDLKTVTEASGAIELYKKTIQEDPNASESDLIEKVAKALLPDKVDKKNFINDLRTKHREAIRGRSIDETLRAAARTVVLSHLFGPTLNSSSQSAKDIWKNHLLLRIWGCHGYSRSRYWSSFSLWRGLSLIGQILELGPALDKNQSNEPALDSPILEEIIRLIRSHCLAGLVPGSLLDRGSNEDRLLNGFTRHEPNNGPLTDAINTLAEALLKWLKDTQEERIFPLPAGKTSINWGDCFIRRIHGEYILGALWPRLNAGYLEDHVRRSPRQELAHLRSFRDENLLQAMQAEINLEKGRNENSRATGYPEPSERFRWTAALAAATWSDTILEYWRGCPSILFLLITCPVFFKSEERFGPSNKSTTSPPGHSATTLLRKGLSGEALKTEYKTLSAEEKDRYNWLNRLRLPRVYWDKLAIYWNRARSNEEIKFSPLVPDEFCIERVQIKNFANQNIQHHAITLEPLTITEEESAIHVHPTPFIYPKPEPTKV